MKRTPDTNPQPISAGHRFNNLWAIAKCEDPGEKTSQYTDSGIIRSARFTDQDGLERTALVRTMDMNFIQGSIKTNCREIDILIDDGTVLRVSDYIVSGQPRPEILENIQRLEQIVPALRFN